MLFLYFSFFKVGIRYIDKFLKLLQVGKIIIYYGLKSKLLGNISYIQILSVEFNNIIINLSNK